MKAAKQASASTTANFPEKERFVDYMLIYNKKQPPQMKDPITGLILGVAPISGQSDSGFTPSGKANKTIATRRATYGPGTMVTNSNDQGGQIDNLPQNPNYNSNDMGVRNGN